MRNIISISKIKNGCNVERGILILRRKHLEAKAGTTIFASTGMLGKDYPNRMSTLHFYKAREGSKVCLLNSDYYFNVATYSLNFEEKYIYTYSYQQEQSWTTYNHDLSGDSYRKEDYVFSEEVYFRVCLKRVDDKAFTDEEAKNINKILLFVTEEDQYHEKSYFKDEIQKTAETIRDKRREKSLVLGVLSDSHFTINGTWEDTAHNIQAVHERAKFDGIVHLGDITDGMVSAQVTKQYAKKIIGDLKENKIPLYIVIGNHDTNYFNNNSEPMSKEEQYNIYQSHSENDIKRVSNNLYYFCDFENVSLRCLFLTSFNHREDIRYGFSEKELTWVQKTLERTPSGYAVIIFSHEAPLPELDYWSDEIRNGEKLMSILEDYDSQNGKKIMAIIHGHTHADYIFSERRFPIISIGCAKCEYFTEKKPSGARTQKRKVGTVTQDLWDTLIISPSENVIEFVRFGAGEDREVYC